MEDDKNNTDTSFDLNEISQELAKHLNVYELSTEVMKDIRNSIDTTTVQIEDTENSLEQVNIILKISLLNLIKKNTHRMI